MTCSVRIRAAALLLSCLGAAGPAAAQDLLFIGDAAIGSAGQFGERLGAAPPEVHGQLMNGGRTLVYGPLAIDTATGQLLPVFFGDVLAVEASGPRVFSYDGQTVSMYRLDTGQLTPLVAARRPPTFLGVSARYANEAGQLFVERLATNGGSEMAIVDVASGALVRTVAAGWQGALGWSVSPDGRRLVVNAVFPALYPSGLLVIDAVTGALLHAEPHPDTLGPDLFVDDRHFERTYLLSRSALTAFSDNGQPLGAVSVGSSCAPPSMAVSPHTGRLYVIDSYGGGEFYGQKVPVHHYLTVYDGETARRIDSREITTAAGVPAGSNSCSSLPITVVTAPGAPKQLAASVSGRDLSLSWRDGGGVTAGYVLEVGLAPGQTALTVDLGQRTSASFANVPPGRYVVRLRATNPFGLSRPSNDVTIVVP